MKLARGSLLRSFFRVIFFDDDKQLCQKGNVARIGIEVLILAAICDRLMMTANDV